MPEGLLEQLMQGMVDMQSRIRVLEEALEIDKKKERDEAHGDRILDSV